MRKIVINTCYGGFALSKQALEQYAARKNIDPGAYDDNFGYFENISEHDIERDDPDLVAVVEELEDEADGPYSSLKVVEIPEDVVWSIHEYDGAEWVAEAHRTWS